MAGVFINIPGVGNIEATGAASEATLKELLSAINVGLGNGGGRGGGGGNRGGGGGGGGGGAGGAFNVLGTAAGVLGKGFNKLGVVAGFTTGVVGKLAGGAVKATAATIGLSESIVSAVQALSQLDGSASSAAGIFKNIPLIGPIFMAVAAAADDVTRSYQAVSQSGASFAGSISKFAAASSEAGMSMAEFGSLIKSNSNAMTAFGTTTEGGAANFAKVSKQVRSTGNDLYALGFSTAEINQGLASYGALMKSQGLQGKQSNAQLAQGAKSYLKELDLLAKATGQSRAEVEASMAAMAKDAQFQASMSGLGKGVRDSFLAVTGGLPKGLETFAKDIMSTGTATTEENQKLMAMMPQSAAMLQRMNQKMQRGEAVTLEERNALNNLMKQEGGKQLQNIKYAGAASAELGGTVNALAATQQINANALKQGTEEQKKAAKETDQMNKKMSEFQAAIAEVSNRFKILLATSGILDVLMQAFTGVVSLAEKYLVPAFNIVVSAVIKVANGISMILKPALDYLSDTFGNNGLAGTAKFLDDVLNAVFPIFAGAMRGAIIIFDSLYKGVQSVITPFNDLMSKIFGVSDSTTSLSDIIIDVSGTIGLVFQYLSVGVQAAILAFDGLWLGIQGVIEPFKELMNKIFGVSDSAGGFTDILIDAGEIAGKIFQYLGVVINGVIVVLDGLWNGISAIFQPLKELATNLFGLISSVFGASEGTNGFVDIIMGAGRFLGDLFQTIGKAIGAVIKVIDFALTPVFYILSGAMQVVVGIFKVLYGALKIGIEVFAKLMDIIQDVGMFFGGLMDMILFAVGKLTKGLAGISEDEYKAREKKRDDLKADRAVERKNRDDTSKQSGKEADARDAQIAANLKAGLAQTEANAKNQKAAAQVQIGNYKAELPARLAAQKAAANADARRFAEQKVTHNQLTGAAQREAAAKEAAIKAQEKLLDYTAGPEELLKQFSDKEGGAVEIGIKKVEITKELNEALATYAGAAPGAERKDAEEKIKAAEAKLKALNEAEALAKQRTGSVPSESGDGAPSIPKELIDKLRSVANKDKTQAGLELAAAKTDAEKKAAAEKIKAAEDKLTALNQAEALAKDLAKQRTGSAPKPETDIKKDEINKGLIQAQKELAAAKTDAEKKAAAEKIKAAEDKLKALDAPGSQPVKPNDKPNAPLLVAIDGSTGINFSAQAVGHLNHAFRSSTNQADLTKKELEKQQQDKIANEKKKAEEDVAKKKADEDANKKKEGDNKKPESAETLLAELNTKMATLLKYTLTVAQNTNEGVTATRGLNKNLYKA